jgi:dTDP-4-dehydrorhamnose 3,5-epimerase
MKKINIALTALVGVYEISSWSMQDTRGLLVRFFEPTPPLGPFTLAEGSLIYSEKKNTLRGLHFQKDPKCEGKIIIPVSGRMWWVVVDVRPHSATFGRHYSSTLSAYTHHPVLFVSPGFAHGCLALENETSVIALADTRYDETLATGIIWNDPELNISWPLDGQPIMSEKHKQYDSFTAFRKEIL